jgi:DNA repair protein RadA/Sms
MVTAQATDPKIIIVDSIQTVASNESDAIAWSPSQVKFCSEQLSKRAKKYQITLVIIWHVTKDGEIAWPKYLEHIVDAVYYIEWEKSWQYRFLRSKKNRFWSADEVAIFEMWTQGLQAAYDLHAQALEAIWHNLPWTVVTMWVDSGRPVLLYVETLLSKMKGKYPQRVTLWIETTRLYLLLAIMEKYLQFVGWAMDVFVNIPWEFKWADAGLDIAVIVALWTQRKQKSIPPQTIFLWEVWLAWQILPAKYHQKRKQDLPPGWSCIDYMVIKHIKDIIQYL